MEELAKVRRVIASKLDGAPHETLLVVDATTGQNGLQQARLFAETAGVTGVASRSSTARRKAASRSRSRTSSGYREADGRGEQIDDLRPFDAHGLRARACCG